MTDQTPELLPRLLANNALRADQSKHPATQSRADSKASMILSGGSSLIITITLLQYARTTPANRADPGQARLAGHPLFHPRHDPASARQCETNLVLLRSFSELDKEQFKHQVKQTIADKEGLI